MKVDTEHIHHWIQAIRHSADPMRTMDAFYSGQIKSKEWLIDSLNFVYKFDNPVTIDIHGGWVGTLASLLFQSTIPIKSIRSIDIDPSVKEIAEKMNHIELSHDKFTAITQDMVECDSNADIIINTSCEHITQEQYDLWLSKLPKESIIIVQSNNYVIPEHIRISKNIDEFEQQSNLERKFVGTLKLPLYDRYMIMGKKWK